MPKGHTEKFKKKTVKMMVKGHLTQKEAAQKVGVTETANDSSKRKERSYLASS